MAHQAEHDASAAIASGKKRQLLVAIPALNEEKTVASVIQGIPREIPGVARIEILVVDDGSSDATSEKASQAGARVIRHSATRGVGAAFASALRYGVDHGAELIVSIDADGQFNPADIPALIQPVVEGRADFSTASRFADATLVPKMPALKRWGNAMMSGLVSRLTGQNFRDVSCGMRCYSRRAALTLNPMGNFTYTQEVFLNLAFKQLRIVEVPVAVRGVRKHGESRVAGNLVRYALNTSGIIFRCYRDYKPMLFFGAIAGMAFVIAAALSAFLLFHYLSTGTFTPHKWAGFTAAAIAILGLLLAFMGILGDMLARHRIYLEELLYRERDRHTRNRGGEGHEPSD